MRILLLMLCLGIWVVPGKAAIEAYQFDSPQMEADYNQLIAELRCLVCQNQNLAGSDADLARDLRRETHEMLREGKSPEQVVEFMVARYGDFVLYRPQFKSTTYLLWIGPFLLMLGVLYLLVRRLRQSDGAVEVDADALAQAKKLLEKSESNK